MSRQIQQRFWLQIGLGATAVSVLGGWVLLFGRLLDPAKLPEGYSSDSAIPVLMANEDTLRIESLYYWAQDRFSGVPFLVGSCLHRLTGFFWTPSAWALVQATWVALSVWVLWRW